MRKAVAKQGYGLNKLVKDNNRDVREEVAKQFYGLNELIYDDSDSVRELARTYLLIYYEKHEKTDDME